MTSHQVSSSGPRRAAALAAAAALLLGLGACGGGGGNGIADEAPEDALAQAVEAAREAGTVLLRGGSSGGGERLELDLRLSAEAGATGSITVDGGTAQVRFDGDERAFLQGDEAFWQASGAPEDLVGALAGQFVEAPQFADALRELTDFDAFVDGIAEPEGDLRAGEVAEVSEADGAELYELVTDQGSLFLATEGEPYPVLLRDDDGDLLLSDWGAEVAVELPEDAPTVDDLVREQDAAGADEGA